MVVQSWRGCVVARCAQRSRHSYATLARPASVPPSRPSAAGVRKKRGIFSDFVGCVRQSSRRRGLLETLRYRTAHRGSTSDKFGRPHATHAIRAMSDPVEVGKSPTRRGATFGRRTSRRWLFAAGPVDSNFFALGQGGAGSRRVIMPQEGVFGPVFFQGPPEMSFGDVWLVGKRGSETIWGSFFAQEIGVLGDLIGLPFVPASLNRLGNDQGRWPLPRCV